MTGQLRGACAALQPQVASQAGPTLATLQGLGVTVDAATLCSVPLVQLGWKALVAGIVCVIALGCQPAELTRVPI